MALAVVAVSVVRAQAPPGAPPAGAARPPARPSSRPLAFSAAAAGWAWIVGGASPEEAVLMTGSVGATGREVGRGQGWVDVAAAGETLWVIERRGSCGALLRLPRTGGRPERVAVGLARPGSVAARGETVYWTETVVPPRPVLPFLPVGGAMIRVSTLRGGRPAVVAQYPAADIPAERGDLLAVDDAGILIRVRRPASTEFVRLDPRSGATRRVGAEPGTRSGVVFGGKLCWTAPSEESSAEMVCVRREDGRGGSETLSDWLPSTGQLVAAGPHLYFVADHVYEIPARLEIARRHAWVGYPQAAADGDKLILLGDTPAPVVFKPGAR